MLGNFNFWLLLMIGALARRVRCFRSFLIAHTHFCQRIDHVDVYPYNLVFLVVVFGIHGRQGFARMHPPSPSVLAC